MSHTKACADLCAASELALKIVGRYQSGAQAAPNAPVTLNVEAPYSRLCVGYRTDEPRVTSRLTSAMAANVNA